MDLWRTMGVPYSDNVVQIPEQQPGFVKLTVGVQEVTGEELESGSCDEQAQQQDGTAALDSATALHAGESQ